MQNKLNQFVNKAFKYDGKIYIVEDVSVKSLKAILKTDRRTFILFKSELDDLISKIEFCDLPEPSQMVVMQPMIKNSILTNQIIEQNSLSTRMSKKLEEVFDELSGTPDEDSFKKAKSMVDVANSIVNVQMANYKYLTLNR